MPEPMALKRGKKFHNIVQHDFETGTKDGGVFPERHVSFANYDLVKKSAGRMDIFVDCSGDSIAIFEIKATDWDNIKPKNIKRNVYRHQKQLFEYVYKHYDLDELYATYGIIYPTPPKTEGLRDHIESICENDYCCPAYWYTELNDEFDITMLDN